MASFGLVGQFYVLCAAVGCIYLVIVAVMGHMHGITGTQSHLDSGTVHGAHGGPASHAAHSGTGAASTASTQDHLPPLQPSPKERFGPIRFVLSMLSPFSIAVFLAFFGISGMFIHGLFPALSWLTAIPALIMALAITRMVSFAVEWMMASLFVSSAAKGEDIIGQIGEVCLPIEEEGTGEVTYVIGSSRYNAPARSIKPGLAFKRGSKVMIADLRNNVAYVEPWNDYLLDTVDSS